MDNSSSNGFPSNLSGVKQTETYRSYEDGKLIEVIEKEIIFVEGKGSESRSNGPPTFAKIENFKDSRNNLFPKMPKQQNKESYLIRGGEVHRWRENNNTDYSYMNDNRYDISADGSGRNIPCQDTQYFLSSGGLNLDLKNLKMSQSNENTTERHRLHNNGNPSHNDIHLKKIVAQQMMVKSERTEDMIDSGKSKEQSNMNMDTDRANFCLVEELSQQIVKLNSMNSNLQKEVHRLNDDLRNKEEIERLEEIISRLKKDYSAVKSECEKMKNESKITLENFKKYHEEMMSELERRNKKVLETLKNTYENELEWIKKENKELIIKLKTLQSNLSNNSVMKIPNDNRYQRGISKEDSPTSHIIKTPKGIVFPSRGYLKSQNKTTEYHDECEDESEDPPQVIVSPKPKSRSKKEDRVSEEEGFYCTDKIEDFHSYLKETQGIDSSFHHKNHYSNKENKKPQSNIKQNNEESFTLIMKSNMNKHMIKEVRPDLSSDFMNQPKRDTSQKNIKSIKRVIDKDKHSIRQSDNIKMEPKSSIEKKDPTLKIHKSNSRALDLILPYPSIISNPKTKTGNSVKRGGSKSRNKDRSISKKSAKKSAKKSTRPINPMKSRGDLTSSSAWKKDPNQNSFMTNVSGAGQNQASGYQNHSSIHKFSTNNNT